MNTPIEEFLRGAPAPVDARKISQQWLQLGQAYDVENWQLPLPLWAKRPFEDDGEQAWEKIDRYAEVCVAEKPICIYIHIPFCSSKCGFCDSYSFKLANKVDQHMDAYVDKLRQEIRLWGRIGLLAQRPVATVHLGGGTPSYLSQRSFTNLMAEIKSHFNVSEATEWALESTVESLTPDMQSFLHDQGFRRLHVGVQCLEEIPRQMIGRRKPAADVLNCIAWHLEKGWVVSVDLICGLPGQTLLGWLADIQTLMAVGTNGFSLYELLIYPQNFRWAEKHGLTERDHLSNFCLFQAGAAMLDAHGFTKNLFNHWADERDENIYFTHPTRGEDLVAFGTIANGNLGPYHYRHHFYKEYLKAVSEDFPGLQGGLLESPNEQQIKQLANAILSGWIPCHLTEQFEHFTINGNPILQYWVEHGLLTSKLSSGYALTDTGSWLAGNMIEEVNRAIVI